VNGCLTCQSIRGTKEFLKEFHLTFGSLATWYAALAGCFSVKTLKKKEVTDKYNHCQ